MAWTRTTSLAGVALVVLLALCAERSVVVLADDVDSSAKKTEDAKEQPKEDESQLHSLYAEGSLCGYCEYCRFCDLCKKDCPCETSPSKPNCHMCKYCKFCYLCSGVCDTVCTPGGVIDLISSSIYRNIPKLDLLQLTDDIDSVKDYL
ncbi:sarcoplasmic reticulum histidine-rich calcium-binding protein-like [Ptychodera flava]|uniref:sarcoplasmic reticulum histidine-rich calcium-binding protein-like n=1 Tax=Ptychodera flava TaxID=63121 RepID=UPI00396A60BF